MTNSPNTDPIFISRPFHWDAELNSQILPRVGGIVTATTPVLLGTAGDNGGVISSVVVNVTGNTTAANVCVLFTLRDGQISVRKRAEVGLSQVSAAANTAAIANYPVRFTLPDQEPFEGGTASLLKLEPKESLYAALLQAETTSKFIVHAVGGLYDQA